MDFHVSQMYDDHPDPHTNHTVPPAISENQSIQRSLTKAIARHGLGLYIYAGEDLPESESKVSTPAKSTSKKASG